MSMLRPAVTALCLCLSALFANPALAGRAAESVPEEIGLAELAGRSSEMGRGEVTLKGSFTAEGGSIAVIGEDGNKLGVVELASDGTAELVGMTRSELVAHTAGVAALARNIIVVVLGEVEIGDCTYTLVFIVGTGGIEYRIERVCLTIS